MIPVPMYLWDRKLYNSLSGRLGTNTPNRVKTNGKEVFRNALQPYHFSGPIEHLHLPLVGVGTRL